MANFKERKSREMQQILDDAKIEHMLKNYFKGRDFYLKGVFDPSVVKIIEFRPPHALIVEAEYHLENEVFVYRVFNKYLEAACIVTEDMGASRYVLEVKSINIATDGREDERIVLEQGQAIINNIRAARNNIKASLFNIPTSVKVHFSQYEQKLQSMADDVHIRVFDKSDDKLELVRKSGKILHLEDTQDIMSYMTDDTDGFIDYREVLNTEVGNVMDEYRKKKIVSELIVPVIYIGHDGIPVPLGYIQLVSRSDKIDIGKAMELKALTFEMVDRIRDSNTMLINKRQPVQNVSNKGLQLRFNDPELKKFLIHQRGFSFDIVFKLQQPITASTEIVYTGITPDKDLIIGVRIVGFSSRKGEADRFYDMVRYLGG